MEAARAAVAAAASAALNRHAALADSALAESGADAETGATERMTAPRGAVAGAGFGGFLVVRDRDCKGRGLRSQLRRWGGDERTLAPSDL